MYFLKTPCFQNFTWLVDSGVFFRLHLVEVREREREDGDGCCVPDVQDFGCKGTSIFVMGSMRKVNTRDEVSLRNETRVSGRIGMALALACSVHLVFL